MQTTAERLVSLGAFLRAHERLWRPRPFAGEPLPWRDEHPELAAWLEARSEDEVEALQEADLTEGPPPLSGWARDAAAWAEVPFAEARATLLEPPADRPPRRVRGRKWRQVHAFASAVLPDDSRPTHWVEWCSGKATLGRALAGATEVGLTALERDPDLCAAGRAASGNDERVRYVQADVLAEVDEHVPPGAAIVGLHACGDLTDAMLRVGVRRGASRLAAAPCCPHKRRGAYIPMSEAGRAAELRLGKTSLMLAVSGEIVGSARIRRLRRRALVWRAAFSQLVGPGYHALPSMPDSQLRGTFRAFAERWAVREGFTLPKDWDERRTLVTAADHVTTTRALGLVRAPFRGALELFTVLDRAAWLEEAGRDARIVRFCPPRVTPRNLLVTSRST